MQSEREGGSQAGHQTLETLVGAAVVASIFLLLILTALGGWPWVAKFLESSAPAWIQAIGSVAAIAAAVIVVHRQHALELQRREREDHVTQLRRARSLRVIFLSASRVCEDVARCIGKPHQTWTFKAEELREVRSRLLAIDPLQVPNGGLLLLIEECTMRLQSCALIVGELETARAKQTEEAIKRAVMAAARECWLGFFESTSLEAKLCQAGISEEKPYAIDDFAASRQRLDEIRASFQNEEASGASRHE